MNVCFFSIDRVYNFRIKELERRKSWYEGDLTCIRNNFGVLFCIIRKKWISRKKGMGN